jgi:hypothetical protein
MSSYCCRRAVGGRRGKSSKGPAGVIWMDETLPIDLWIFPRSTSVPLGPPRGTDRHPLLLGLAAVPTYALQPPILCIRRPLWQRRRHATYAPQLLDLMPYSRTTSTRPGRYSSRPTLRSTLSVPEFVRS